MTTSKAIMIAKTKGGTRFLHIVSMKKFKT